MSKRSQKICVVKVSGLIAPCVMDGYARAFEAAGHEVFVLDTRNLQDQPQALEARLNELIRWKPDLTVGYGYTGLVWTPDGALLQAIGTKVALLHYDCPFFNMTSRVLEEFHRHPTAYVHFVWDRTFLEAYRAASIDRVHPILLAADPAVFSTRTPNYRFNVSFVGRADDITPLRADRQSRYSQRMNEFFDDVLAQKMERPAEPLLDLWREIRAARFPEVDMDWGLYLGMYAEGTSLLRLSLLQAIQAEQLDLFGVGFPGLPNATYHDDVDYFSELPALYADSRVNLNISALQLEHSLNNRVFDVAAVGGFVLTDDRSDLHDLFPRHAEIAYTSAAELDDKIAYYLAHDDERRELAAHLQREVLANHTYRERAAYVLRTVNGEKQ